MAGQELDYAAIRGKIDKGVARQKWSYRIIFFVIHLLMYLISMAAVWGVMATNPSLRSAVFNEGSAAPLIVILPSVLWGVMVLSHVAALFIESPFGEKNIRERQLLREVGEEILRKGLVQDVLTDKMAEKPKRRAATAAARAILSDDGELLVSDEEAAQPEDRQSRADRAGGANH